MEDQDETCHSQLHHGDLLLVGRVLEIQAEEPMRVPKQIHFELLEFAMEDAWVVGVHRVHRRRPMGGERELLSHEPPAVHGCHGCHTSSTR